LRNTSDEVVDRKMLSLGQRSLLHKRFVAVLNQRLNVCATVNRWYGVGDVLGSERAQRKREAVLSWSEVYSTQLVRRLH